MGVYLFHGWTEKPIKRRRYWKAKLKKREGTNETILFRAFWNRCKHIIVFHSQSFIPHAKAYKDFFLFSNPLNGLGRLQHERYLLVQILVIIQFPSWVESLCFFFFYVYIFLKVYIPWKALVPNIIQLPTWIECFSWVKSRLRFHPNSCIVGTHDIQQIWLYYYYFFVGRWDWR